jgi:hypothetical protein
MTPEALSHSLSGSKPRRRARQHSLSRPATALPALRRAGTVIILTPDDISTSTTLASSCAGGVPDNETLLNCVPTGLPAAGKDAWVVGPYPDPYGDTLSETSGGRNACVIAGSVTGEFSDTESYNWGDKLSRWQGSLKLTVSRGCGGAIMLTRSLTDMLKGVPIANIQHLSFRSKRVQPADQPSDSNLNIQIDFDVDVSRQQLSYNNTYTYPPPPAPYAAYDTLWMGRLYARSQGPPSVWGEIVATSTSAPSNASEWVKSNSKPDSAHTPGGSMVGSSCVSPTCKPWSDVLTKYPFGGFGNKYDYVGGPDKTAITLKYGTNTGELAAPAHVYYVDSITLNWKDVTGVPQKRTWAFKVGTMGKRRAAISE